MPPQMFRRSAMNLGWRPRAAEVCRRLAEDLDHLTASTSGPSHAALGSDATVNDPVPVAAPPARRATHPIVADKAVEGFAAAQHDGSHGFACGSHPQGNDEMLRSISEDVQRLLQITLGTLDDSGEYKDHAGIVDRSQDAGDGTGEFLDQFLIADLPVKLVANLGELQFEVRKDVIRAFSVIVRLGSTVGAGQQIQDYVRNRPRFFPLLVDGYSRPEIATHCGMMLRSCARHRQLVATFLEQPEVVYTLLAFTSHGSFDVSSDAFSSLHDFLLIHKDVASSFLEANFQEFFRLFNELLLSDDYVTQRQSLKLLSEVLLDRTFMRVMLMYIGEEQFLQIHMNLLKADSKAIQFEAFHVFKIFVANPQKPPRVQHILYRNKEKLVRFLETLGANRQEDRQFVEDRSTVIGKLQGLEQPASAKRDAGGNAVVSPQASGSST